MFGSRTFLKSTRICFACWHFGLLELGGQEVIALSSAELRRSGSGDRVQLQQIILNLLLNAADAMAGIEDRAKTLRVQTQISGSDRVNLLVQDSGAGLDPRGIEKLFETFCTTKANSLGIKLAISRSIIESHQGQLWARANDGPGAAFGFSIPCASSDLTDSAAIATSNRDDTAPKDKTERL
jgi:C4-dicarboxylate-specific signal transduction histidine kinase